ncbi:MAG: extracellular solute-binding protein [Clostridiales bacterium]|nr:extracellular solute-binding protein [Clostridiales bacterium]
MKRFFSMITACALVVSAIAFTGCGNGNNDNNNGTDSGNVGAGDSSSGDSGSDDSGQDNGNTTKDSVNLKIWGAQDDQALLREMCEEFAAANKDKTYNFTFGVVGEGDAKKTFLDDPDAAADIFSFSNDQLADLVSAGALAQIGGSYKNAVENDNGAGSVDAATIDGKLYAFPATADNGYFLYYNKAVFDKAPDTIDDILEKCTDGKKFAMKISDSWYVASFFLTAGCTFSDDKKIDFNSPSGLDAAKAMNKLCKDSRFINFGADYDPSIVSGFGDGSIVAAVSGTWNAEKIANEIGEENLGATKLPKIELGGEYVQMKGFAGYKMIGVNANSKNPQDAVKLAAWLTNEENQLKRFNERQIGPSNVAAAENEAVKANVALAALAEQLQYSVSQNNVPSSYWTAAEGFGTDLVSGKISDDALQGMLDTLVNTVNNPAL